MSVILDGEVLDILIEAIGPDGARAVIELFITESRELTAAMAAPAAARADIGRAAHSLKSSAGQLGAVALSEAALAVETAVGVGAPELERLVATLAERSTLTRDALAVRLADF